MSDALNSSAPIDPDIQAMIDAAARAAYQQESEFSHIPLAEMPASPRCRQVAGAMVSSLFESGIPIRPETRGGWEVDEHRYGVLTIDGTEVVADPTWKQFVPEGRRTTELPDVLIGTRATVVEMARQHGVSPANLLLWQPRDAHPQPERPMSVAERIAAEYDSRR